MAKTIELTQGKVAWVSECDFERVSEHKWTANRQRERWYVRARIEGKHITLHRFILNTPDGLDVDHENNNGFDNTRSNIRNCTHRQNIQRCRPRSGGTSRYKGVSWQAAVNRWHVGIYVNSEKLFLGLYADEDEAAKVYNRAAKKYFGDFAYLNTIIETGDTLPLFA